MPPRLITDREFRQSIYAAMTDAAEGVNLSATIMRAEAIIEGMVNRRLSRTTYTEYHKPTRKMIFLRHRPIIEFTEIRRRISPLEEWIDVPQYYVEFDKGAGVITAVDPYEIGGWEIEVTYDAGYDPIPDDIKQAVIMQTAMLLYADQETITPGDGKPPGIRYIKEDIDAIVRNYRKGSTLV